MLQAMIDFVSSTSWFTRIFFLIGIVVLLKASRIKRGPEFCAALDDDGDVQ